jgi:membrane protease YdiL (CAAX protease family)
LDYPADGHTEEDIKPGGAPRRNDALRLAIRVTVFVVLFYGLGWFVLDPLLRWFAGNLAGPTLAVLVSAVFATWLSLRIYEDVPVFAVGLWWNGASAQNLKLGLLGGVGAAVLALAPPLAMGAAHISATHAPEWGAIAFSAACVAAGSAGEEIFFRGYGFQLLLANWGPWAAIVPVGVVFGWMHSANPDASPLGLINTAGFGILFGYAFLRSRDLWLPIGLHFGWNFALPLFGANLSGITIFKEITGHEMVWRAGDLWSGGGYGPEASVLTSAVLIPLFVYLWKAPIRRQPSPLTDLPGESAICEPSPPLPS